MNPAPEEPSTGRRHSAVRSVIRTADRVLRRGRLRKLRKRVIVPLLVTSALALTAAAVGLMAHPQAAATLSALTTVYIAVVSTQRMREERSTPPAPEIRTRANVAEHRVAGDLESVRNVPCDEEPRSDRAHRGEPDLGTASPFDRTTTDTEPRTERTRFLEDIRDQQRSVHEARSHRDRSTGDA
ncbi:hypothetical protein ETD83_21700 [Actinomadura soli]|uniref:Uncharacterized protein n=1 Tax=Actinomadura soli TaxID=2508997 RepID=A0A5C4J8U9_9ACTN|nr:hypothetical protein [Actinomadura soli]TMQ96185.1 hypothetical protein ETD83_21700 [Actinomadura soli]